MNDEIILRSLIVDDDPMCSTQLTRLLAEFPYVEVVCVLTSSERFAESLKDDIDIVFLDIRIGKESGFSLADYVNAYFPGKMIVFTSGFDQYMQDSYSFEPFDFLVKPVDKVRLERTLLRARQKKDRNANIGERKLGIPTKSGTVFLPIHSILYVEHLSRKSVITYLNNGKIETVPTVESMSSMENMLTDYGFIRVHQSFIVPERRIATLSSSKIGAGYELTLFDCDRLIPVSRSIYKELQEQLRKETIHP